MRDLSKKLDSARISLLCVKKHILTYGILLSISGSSSQRLFFLALEDLLDFRYCSLQDFSMTLPISVSRHLLEEVRYRNSPIVLLTPIVRLQDRANFLSIAFGMYGILR